jgi:hypothetical protein
MPTFLPHSLLQTVANLTDQGLERVFCVGSKKTKSNNQRIKESKEKGRTAHEKGGVWAQ